MNNVRLRIVLIMTSMYLMEVESFFLDLQPARYMRERYERSRNNTVLRSINPTRDFGPVLDFVAIASNFGYPAEEHLVTTLDGYRLRIHRIPGSPSSPKAPGKPVVYFQHGLFASSDLWALMGPDKDLAYMLADAGYDVWLGNARGNTYSRSHVRLSPDYDPEFWNFSFHEIALYDLPVIIDYILEVTGQESLVYVGHSMGTTISYVLLSTNPEYNQKISLLISLAPVAFWRAPPRPVIKFLKDNGEAIKSFVTNARIYEIFPLTAASSRLAKTACAEESPLQQICVHLLYYLSGYNPNQLNTTALPYVLSYFPAGASTRTLIHYSQNINSGNFQMYDYGTLRNLEMYGQSKPPKYPLNMITVPVALFYGLGDSLVAPGNPLELSKTLSNVLMVKAVPDDKFAHFDFLFSKDIKSLLNDHVERVITEMTRQKNIV